MSILKQIVRHLDLVLALNRIPAILYAFQQPYDIALRSSPSDYILNEINFIIPPVVCTTANYYLA